MSDAVIISLIGAVGTAITTIMTLIINKKTSQIHKDVNGKMAQLLAVSGKAEHAAGVVAGKAEQRDQGKETATEVIKQIQADPDIEITKT